MHKLNVDKNYFTMGTFDVQAKPINIQCEFWKSWSSTEYARNKALFSI